MMVGNEDLGLSLTLGSSENHRRLPPLQLNFTPCPSPHPFLLHHKIQWSDLLAPSAAGRGSPAVPLLRGVDVNPSVVEARESEEEEEEEAGASSSPNSTLSSVSGKRGERDPAHLNPRGEEQETERGSPRCGISDEEDGEASRKKLRLSKDQSAVLEESFKEHSTLNPKQKLALAKKLNLRPRQVEVWFQNRRARTKLKQTEVDCEYLKRCCENLTEENRRLQKEVAELRALKLSPHLYMHTTPPTTLTMCPSCERVASASAAAIAPHPPDHHHRPIPIATATPAPWSLLPLRASFMDVQPQNVDHGGCMIFGSRMVDE